jgi:uncharacterized protein YkwD
MRRLRLLLPVLASAAALLAPSVASSSSAVPTCRGAWTSPTAANVAVVRRATLCLLNRQRAVRGLRRLREQRSLQHAAGSYAHLMVVRGFFDHVSPGGSTMVQRIERTAYLHGARAWSVGENLAWGAGSAAAPAQIVSAWMHSPPHRANILNRRFREIGIGIVQGAPARGRSGGTYTTEFGTRHR